ncbi:hypothetical protein [Micromonospora sp. NPDC023888]|uniref:hypothetical protein n=1 Tax=Micromonospora sp. NPDC023888 TaxID=3155607 RepID=UPI0033E31519
MSTDRFATHPTDALPLRLPPALTTARTGPEEPPPITAGQLKPGAPIEVDRLVNAIGLVSLAGRQHSIGYHLAGRRVTMRLDHGVLHLLDADRALLRGLPNPSPGSRSASPSLHDSVG